MFYFETLFGSVIYSLECDEVEEQCFTNEYEDENEGLSEPVPYILIDRVMVKKEFRGKGHGHDLMDGVLKKIRKEYPKQDIELCADPLDDDTELEWLADFYKSHGFTPEYAEGMSGVMMVIRR